MDYTGGGAFGPAGCGMVHLALYAFFQLFNGPSVPGEDSGVDRFCWVLGAFISAVFAGAANYCGFYSGRTGGIVGGFALWNMGRLSGLPVWSGNRGGGSLWV